MTKNKKQINFKFQFSNVQNGLGFEILFIGIYPDGQVLRFGTCLLLFKLQFCNHSIRHLC